MTALIFIVALLAVVVVAAVACFWLFENATYRDTSMQGRELHLRQKANYAQE